MSHMKTSYTIGQLAHAAALPISTLRYYERLGLLDPDGRSEGNYRLYTEAALERLHFIRGAKDAGFTLEDVTTLLTIHDGAGPVCNEVNALIDNRIADLDTRLRDMHQLRTTLLSLQKICRQSTRKDHCRVLDRLAENAR